ncbi:hypothetical protein ASF84_21225 [Pseudomonas sp. Leaf127]|nr:hypothetical protein ASF84_21225 [Pseudomonas sp. Leaf127]
MQCGCKVQDDHHFQKERAVLRQMWVAGVFSAVLLVGGCHTNTIDVNQVYARTYQQTLDEAASRQALDTTSPSARRVQGIAERLMTQAPKLYPDAAQWQWQVSLIKDDELNAKGGPGGKVMIHTGVLDQLQPTDDELAAIIAGVIARADSPQSHEAIRRRHAPAVIPATSRALGMNEAGMALAEQVTEAKSQARMEARVDVQSLEWLARSGYNPNAAVTILEKMLQREGLSATELNGLRRLVEPRTQRLREAIPKVMPLYEQASKP